MKLEWETVRVPGSAGLQPCFDIMELEKVISATHQSIQPHPAQQDAFSFQQVCVRHCLGQRVQAVKQEFGWWACLLLNIIVYFVKAQVSPGPAGRSGASVTALCLSTRIAAICGSMWC